LRAAAELYVWKESIPMAREGQLELFAKCDGLLTTTDIVVDDTLLKACPRRN
jgi:hypothetical protein